MKRIKNSLEILLTMIFLSIILISCSEPVSQKDSISIWKEYKQNFETQKYGYLYSLLSTYVAEPTITTTNQQQQAYFYDSLGNYYPADLITLNGNAISQRNDNKTVTFDGYTYHIWHVTGNQYIPTYSDSILSINSFQITSPNPKTDTVFKNNGKIIQYSNINNIDSVIVYAKLNKGLSSTIDTNYWKSQINYNNVKIFKNTGSINLSSAFFQYFPSNCYITIEIIAIRTKEKRINNRGYITACVVSSRADFILK